MSDPPRFVLDEEDDPMTDLDWIEIAEIGLSLAEVRDAYGEPPKHLLPLFATD